MKQNKITKSLGSIIFLIASTVLFSACGSHRVLVVKSDPPDADVCIKGKARSKYFPNEKSCVGTTPFETDRVDVKDKSGDKREVQFSDVEGDQEKFYVVVSKPGYSAQVLDVPKWEHAVQLKPEAQALAAAIPTVPVSGETPAQPAQNMNKGMVKIMSEPTGALVYVNDLLKGNTPFTYEGPVGSVRIKLELEGFKTMEKIMTIESGGNVALPLSFKLAPAQETPAAPATKASSKAAVSAPKTVAPADPAQPATTPTDANALPQGQ
jgi:hypothetical protein